MKGLLLIRKALPALHMVLLTILLNACGGGGSDGSGGLSYSGSMKMAVINADNAVELMEGAYYGGPTTDSISAFRTTGVSGDKAKPFLQHSALLYSWPIIKEIKKFTISGEVAPELRALQTVTDTIQGNCGGSLTSTLHVDDTSGNFTGTMQNDSYCEDGETTSGNVNVSGTVDLITLEIAYMEMSFDQLTVTFTSGSFTLSGTMSGNFDQSSLSLTLNYLIRDNGSGKVYRVENYVVSTIEGMEWVEITFLSGRYYHPDYGYVDLASVEPFMQYEGDFGPSSGELIITGATPTKASLIALTANAFEVTADIDGDGTFEWSSGILNWSIENTAPVANAGPDQTVNTDSLVQLDGSSSSDIDGDSLSYSWTLQSRPTSSNAILSDPQVVNPTFIADVDGSYVLNLIVNDGSVDSAVVQITVTAQQDIVMLSFQVRDAEYSKPLDRLIMVSATPANRLHIHDILTGDDTAVYLPLPPSSISVGPDGLHAAVGHDGWISYVNLSTATLEKTFAVSTDVLDIVLAGNGYVYAFPRQDQWEYIRSVNIATEVETLSTGRQIYAGTRAKLHPDETSIYGANNGLSPSDIEKYDISSGMPSYLYDSPYHGDYAMCGDLWLSEDGLRIFTKCGNVFRSSIVQSEDMVYNGSLNNTTKIAHLSHSTTTNKVIAIPEASVWPTIGMEDTELHIYDYDFLTFDTVVPLPNFIVSGQAYPAHGRYIFFSADGSIYFTIVQADATAGMLFDYGIIIY